MNILEALVYFILPDLKKGLIISEKANRLLFT